MSVSIGGGSRTELQGDPREPRSANSRNHQCHSMHELLNLTMGWLDDHGLISEPAAL
jgi:hypothetical protein